MWLQLAKSGHFYGKNVGYIFLYSHPGTIFFKCLFVCFSFLFLQEFCLIYIWCSISNLLLSSSFIKCPQLRSDFLRSFGVRDNPLISSYVDIC